MELTKINILITGASGFIGHHLVKKLLSQHANLYLITRSTSNLSRLNDMRDKVNVLQIDSTNELPHIFTKYKFDAIVHLATKYIKHEKSEENIIAMNEANVLYPSLLIELANKNGTKAFINTGTCFEYLPSKYKITEDHRLKPLNYYAATKIAFEQIVKYYSHNKLRGLTLKLFFPYGENDNDKLVQLLINSSLQHKQIRLTKGEQKLSFTYIEDIIDAYIKALEFIFSNKYQQYEVFNIGSDKSSSPRQIVNALEKISHKPMNVSFTLPYASNEIMNMVCNSTKAQNMLGWKPKTNLFEGLEKVYSFYTS